MESMYLVLWRVAQDFGPVLYSNNSITWIKCQIPNEKYCIKDFSGRHGGWPGNRPWKDECPRQSHPSSGIWIPAFDTLANSHPRIVDFHLLRDMQ